MYSKNERNRSAICTRAYSPRNTVRACAPSNTNLLVIAKIEFAECYIWNIALS